MKGQKGWCRRNIKLEKQQRITAVLSLNIHLSTHSNTTCGKQNEQNYLQTIKIFES